MRALLIALLLLLFCSFTSSAQQSQTKGTSDYFQDAIQAYKQKDYTSYDENLRKVYELGARHPLLIYKLAGASSLLGKASDSIIWLRQLADAGLYYDASSDPDFVSLKSQKE